MDDVLRRTRRAVASDSAWWLDVQIELADRLDGKIEIEAEALTGPNLVIDRVVVMPQGNKP
jgi:hypothetical protein